MIKGTLAALNIFSVLLLLLSASAAYVNPNVMWHFSFLGMLFPILVILNLLFALMWIVKLKWFALVPVLALAVCYKFIILSFGMTFEKGVEKGTRILSWNVRNFDLYNWNKNRETRAAMMQVIADEKPDILCLQEYYTDNGVIMDNETYLKDTLGFKYHYFKPTATITKPYKKTTINQHWGVAIFSRFPIVETGRIDFRNSKNNDCIYAGLLIGKDTLRVYNMHLQSIHLGYDDYSILQDMEEYQKPKWFEVRKILAKVKRGMLQRSGQAEQVAESVEASGRTCIIAGDFNDTPISYTYHVLAAGMNDAFAQKGFGMGKTFINRLYQFRIDYLLASSAVQFNSYRTINKTLSDHYALSATFSM
jgi:endonuclease/exonuclease/phosphatase family metal-dependent hydrolase